MVTVTVYMDEVRKGPNKREPLGLYGLEPGLDETNIK
jgi:hypothetical protein